MEGKIKQWKYVPSLQYCHLIDTPGLVDSMIQDRQVIQEMTRYFKSLENGVSAFFLVFNINDIRYEKIMCCYFCCGREGKTNLLIS